MTLEFKSPVAKRWVTNYLYFHEIVERFAQHVPEEGYAWSIGGGTDRLGATLRAIAEEVLFHARVTVEINPMADEDTLFSKDSVIDMLERGRGALTRSHAGMSDTRISQPRFTPLLGGESTLVESMVMLTARVQFLLGKAHQIAEAHGVRFDMGKAAEYPHPVDAQREARSKTPTERLPEVESGRGHGSSEVGGTA